MQNNAYNNGGGFNSSSSGGNWSTNSQPTPWNNNASSNQGKGDKTKRTKKNHSHKQVDCSLYHVLFSTAFFFARHILRENKQF